MSPTSFPTAPVVAESHIDYPAVEQEHWVEALVDCPGAHGLFTYSLPIELQVQPGDILRVPFGSQQVGAIAVRLVAQLPPELKPGQLRPVAEVIHTGFLAPSYWTLLQRVAHYYHTSLIQAIRVALPPGLLRRSQRRIRLASAELPVGMTVLCPAAQQLLALLRASPTGDYTWKFLQERVKGAQQGLQELLQRGLVHSYLKPQVSSQPKLQSAVTLLGIPDDLTVRQREILEVLKQRGGDMWLQDLLQACRTSSTTLKSLVQKGGIAIESRQVLRLENSPIPQSDRPPDLTPAQIEALAKITALSGFAQVLLHGVTGSGKTEVYLQAIAPILAQGQSALVLVPEIGLTPQLTDRFRARFGAKVCVYHSALSDGERYDTWRQLLGGVPQVVIGTRSAVFVPLPRLGLIILDEEHDAGFKQDQPPPCYHARTVAYWRAQLENCPLVCGSATPSLETWVAVKQAAPHYLSLPQRVRARPLPPITVVDMRQELQQGNRSIFSRTLTDALQQLLTQRQQGLLFIHRRGHSTFVSCRSCGQVMECPNCDVSLTYHRAHETAQPWLRCHYCNYSQIQPQCCPACGSPYFKHFGSGTQRVVQELAHQFPQLRLIRFDSDTTRTKGAHRALLHRFAQGEADLLVGTQMLTKGIDLPQVRLVGVVAADGLLNLADYRASERAFQTLTQVAGRSGRGDDPGQVIIQTYAPHHPVIQAVQRYEWERFVSAELQQRAELNYPPYGQLVLLRLSSPNPELVQATAQSLAQFLREELPSPAQLLGPAPANILRVAGRYRWQILLKLPANVTGEIAVTLPVAQLRSRCPASVRLTLDIDPLTFL